MSQDTEVWNIKRLLTWTTDFLRKRGAESPRLDAEVLLAAARGCPRIALYTAFDEEPPEEIKTKFRDWVKRRAAGAPVAYLVGKKEFFSLAFEVTPDVLIPRPDTETLVVSALDAVKELSAGRETIDVADLGTGSGAIAVTLAKQNPKIRVVAVDKSPKALAVAKRNAEAHGVADRIEFVESDWFSAVDKSRQFDVVASNPPYILTSEMATLARDVKDYEPQSALESGPTGLECIQKIIPQAAERLRPGGRLFIEMSPQIAEGVQKLLAAEKRLTPLPAIKDYGQLARVATAKRENR
ncbi:MAG TPA: peptide chain release factor N(5)-glutamine methyltransferase [Pirellulales bacterium]